jgi:tRNA pseudouridine32 synthase/23S rRNA pseudouridine746 synthase/23S rRNA pseudouridine1911/1915/1917 synthase
MVRMTPDEIQARILYRDALIIIINKPAGLPVHAGPKGGPNLEQYFDALRFGLPRPPALAHRLDRDTSGCLILGRHPKALRKAGILFQNGRVEKTYWAVVEGSPPAEQGRVNMSLKKETPKQGWKMIIAKDGQEALTEYKVMGRSEGRTWLELKPHTGRTHQIRVHTQYLGCPVVGDPTYGIKSKTQDGESLMLHSRGISLPLYPSRPPVAVTAPPPPHMVEALKACGWPGY